jgi:hypothetical protein
MSQRERKSEREIQRNRRGEERREMEGVREGRQRETEAERLCV